MTTPPHPSGPPEQERGPTPADVPPGPPPPGHPGAHGYGYPNYPGYPPQGPTNGFAIASLVLGILIIFWGFTSVLALVFGYIARKQIRERGESGAGLALAGIVLGWVGVGLWGIFLIFVILAFVFGGY
jgi:Domain of unknown function (DUF4190)